MVSLVKMVFDGWRGDSAADPESARDQMVDRLQGRISNESTDAALRAVPRHAFVEGREASVAYADRPLPIGQDQTISAPHMVAEMVDCLDLDHGDRVLEIGTGCGYHAAVTAEIVGPTNVYSVEYHAGLAEEARATLAELGYADISIRVGDGHDGWPEHAPYDAAYLTCAAPAVPDAIVAQVRTGGQILAPLGTSRQRLILADKQADGSLDRAERGPVRFVPMVGGQ